MNETRQNNEREIRVYGILSIIILVLFIIVVIMGGYLINKCKEREDRIYKVYPVNQQNIVVKIVKE